MEPTIKNKEQLQRVIGMLDTLAALVESDNASDVLYDAISRLAEVVENIGD